VHARGPRHPKILQADLTLDEEPPNRLGITKFGTTPDAGIQQFERAGVGKLSEKQFGLI
jgi:hypothetical protein